MQYEIHALCQSKSGPIVQPLFGHSTKGVPGIEILGLGPVGRQLKEKLMYLSKIRGIKIPLRRYVLCLSNPLDKGSFSMSELQWLELPLLILFWRMVGVLPLSITKDCITSGTISPQGLITQRASDVDYYIVNEEPLKWIFSTSVPLNVESSIFMVEIEELFSGIKELKFSFKQEKSFGLAFKRQKNL